MKRRAKVTQPGVPGVPGVPELRTRASCQAPAEGSTAPSNPRGRRKEERQGPREPDTGPREAGATVGGAWPTAWASLRGGVLVVAVREAAGTSGTGNETRFPAPNGISDHTPLRGRTPGLMPAASHLAA